MSGWKRVSLESARDFLDFAGARPADLATIAPSQLEGAVAIHNRLARRHVAWLADEVGMGKTYVALGVVALLKHQNPAARVLIIVPSSRLQEKWIKEIALFTRSCVKHADGRARGASDLPARPMVKPGRLYEMGREMVLDADRDMLVTMSSFSFGLGAGEDDEPADYSETWRELAALAPQLGEPPPLEALHDKDLFKSVYASALNRLLPMFDLVICDEAHNLRAGAGHDAARNLTMAAALGGCDHPTLDLPWPTASRPRLSRLLCLTATPVERDYDELSLQAEVFGLNNEHPGLPSRVKSDLMALRRRPTAGEEDLRKDIARRYVLRRIQSLHGPGDENGATFTKNQYRREWREGGVVEFDRSMAAASDCEKLVIALIQKSVVETLHESEHRRSDGVFLPSFQIGMLSSFESFSETIAKKVSGVKPAAEEQAFEGKAQGARKQERQGVDSAVVDRLCGDYRQRFGSAPPHPKMDQVAEEAARLALRGDKSLVFVRRVRSTGELAEKISERLDEALLAYVENELSRDLRPGFHGWRDQWANVRRLARSDRTQAQASSDEDTGDAGSFFAWFFRGTGNEDHQVGARLRRDTFQRRSHAWSIFFHDNHVSWLFGDDEATLERWTRDHDQVLRREVGRRMAEVAEPGPSHLFEAWQASALALLAHERAGTPTGDAAAYLVRELYPAVRRKGVWEGASLVDSGWLRRQTFFSRLRRIDLAEALWPGAAAAPGDGGVDLREREERRELMASTLRLGNPYVDLWLSAVGRLKSLRASHAETVAVEDLADALIGRLLAQRAAGEVAQRSWHELELLARNHALLVNVNFSDVHAEPLPKLAQYFQRHLSRQSPVLAIHGGSKSKQALTQFRMPGFPLVLVATDVLQEGVDLHTFCARVMHYGIAPMSSSTEQRTGRVDRIGGLVHRRFDPRDTETHLQVHYPHLRDSVEPLQLAELYRRMAVSLRLMHNGLGVVEAESSSISLGTAMLRELDYPKPPLQRLESSFNVVSEGPSNDLHGEPLARLAMREADLERLDADIRALVAVSGHSSQRHWEGTFPVGVSQSSALAGKVRIELCARRDGQGPFLRVSADAGRVALHDGRTAAKFLRRQEALVGATVGAARGACDKRLTPGSLDVHCELALPPGKSWQFRLRIALDAVTRQSHALQADMEARRTP